MPGSIWRVGMAALGQTSGLAGKGAVQKYSSFTFLGNLEEYGIDKYQFF
jgi:hypothetical protein